jgi:hypothetical protein
MNRIIVILLFVMSTALAQDSSPYDYTQPQKPLIPNTYKTPGALYLPKPTVDEMCTPGYTKTVRDVPWSLKKKVFERYGIDPKNSSQYEVDHLISLQLGGSNDITNLWPQAYGTKPWNARVKDKLENYLHREICQGRMDRSHAQSIITGDWIDTYCILFNDMYKECLDYRKKQ